MEADDIVTEDENYRDISDKTLDSIFALESWKTSINTISKDCERYPERNQMILAYITVQIQF